MTLLIRCSDGKILHQKMSQHPYQPFLMLSIRVKRLAPWTIVRLLGSLERHSKGIEMLHRLPVLKAELADCHKALCNQKTLAQAHLGIPQLCLLESLEEQLRSPDKTKMENKSAAYFVVHSAVIDLKPSMTGQDMKNHYT